MRLYYFPLLIMGILGISLRCNAVQVDGYCYLENQTIHDGTRVLFEADSPGAVTDSAFTDSSGYYHIDLIVGVYDIFFAHEGFRSYSILDQIISTPTTIPDITLFYIPEGVHISGNVSGILEDTTYIVEGDIVVPYNTTLDIEAGATFYFLGDSSDIYWIRVRGQLHANGTETDSIRFLSAPGTPYWDRIWIPQHYGTTFEYCVFSDFKYGIIIQNDGPTRTVISHCTIRDIPDLRAIPAIDIIWGNPIISNCTIIGSDLDSYGIQVNWIESDPDILQCKIYGHAVGIFCVNEPYANISRCTIRDNQVFGIVCLDATEINIYNCTIVENLSNGIDNDGSNVNIINSIVANNGGAGMRFEGISNNYSVRYNDFYGNSNGDFIGSAIPQHLGEFATVNANGDSCDIFYNIFLNPLLNGNYHLQTGSPCIDAGDPTSPLDPDSTIADIGAFYYDQLSVNDNPKPPLPTDFQLHPAYPNPFNASTVLAYTIPHQGKITLSIYNVMGQQVAILWNGMQSPGTHAICWNPVNCGSGIYFACLKSEYDAKSMKLLLVK